MVKRPRKLRQTLIVALALAVVVLAGVGIATRNRRPNAKAVVALWTPNHTKYCSAVDGLTELWQGAVHKPITARWELTYLEDFAVYAPTRQIHSQVSAMAVAFANLLRDPSGLLAFTRNPEWAPVSFFSKDPKVLAFLKSLAPYDTVKATQLSNAGGTCETLAPGTPNNVVGALSEATTAYYLNVASVDTNATTIAQYEARVALGTGEHVVADGKVARFIFDQGIAVCVTLSAPTSSPPAVVNCHGASAG